jgi:serine/threonine protein kinase
MSSRERFIRCKHCGLPHEANATVCPVTNQPIANDRPKRAKTVSEEAQAYQWAHSLHPLSGPIEDHDQLEERSFMGRVIEGKYLIKEIIGRGGMGAVYRAENQRIGKHVAIKVLLRGHKKGSDSEKRFYREARIVGSLGHPNIVEIFDLGTLENGVPYQVMELLEGQTLAARLKDEGPLPIDEALDVGEQVLSALDVAHARGIVHRDLKPDNVFLVARESGAVAKLLDFGISKTIGEETLSLTKTGMVVGTPYYLAPEQARGESIDHRVDVWAMAVLLYEALTGRLPFRAENYNKLIVTILTTRPITPRELRPAIPQEIEDVILAAMSHDREGRYAGARGMLRALRAARGRVHAQSEHGLRSSAPPPRPSAPPPPLRPSALPPPLRPSAPPPAASPDVPISVPEYSVPEYAVSGTDLGREVVSGAEDEDPNDDPTEISDLFARSTTSRRRKE